MMKYLKKEQVLLFVLYMNYLTEAMIFLHPRKTHLEIKIKPENTWQTLEWLNSDTKRCLE